jgi:AraC-like DNA-binding protein
VLFHERTYRHDALVSPKLFHLQRCCDCPGATYGWFEEQFHDLLARLLQAHRNIFQEIERVPAARAATRAELYTRLHRARDFMEANLRGSLTLAEIAETAYLSPHHFLRLFKQVFSETPHQYIIHRRIERARHLLLHTDTPVTDICFQIGFESLGSFSWLFHRRVGVSPETYRLQNRGPVFAIRNGKKAARSDKSRAKDLCAQPLS